MKKNPLIVGIGATTKAGSSTERALAFALQRAERSGARTILFGRDTLIDLPHYEVGRALSASAQHLIAAIREADGLVIAGPGYHGSLSGLVKNAIDYIEEMKSDTRIYLEGMPVGLIATAYGWQAAVNTLAALRSVVHALRGWPTPIGVAVNSQLVTFHDDGCSDETIKDQMQLMVEQIMSFGHREAA